MTTTATGSPWVYIFSRFTSEALLFEALIIFTLCALYTGFWLLRKRKFGVIKKEVPAGVVKFYLNELIGDAEQLRAQLFGLLAGHGVQPTALAGLNFGSQNAAATVTPTPISIVAGDPQSAQTLAALEAKLTEQAKQIETFIAEKAKIEQELVAAKAAGGTAPAAASDDSKLKDKVAQLEAKLAEYSVIEDDLANLKRLQQENNALKAQLGGKPAPVQETKTPLNNPKAEEPNVVVDNTELNGPSVTAQASAEKTKEASVAAAAETKKEAAASAAPTATPKETAATAAPEQTQAKTGKAAAATGATATSGATAAPTPGATDLGAAVAEAEAAPAEPGAFEGLVDQVEQSLKKPVAAQTATPTTPSPTRSTEAAPAVTIEKSDADLVAEFEKMLNG